MSKNYQFARRGVGPEFKDSGSGSRGPLYDPQTDHPLLIPTTIERLGLGPGVLSALILSTLWFIAMLRTSEMPH